MHLTQLNGPTGALAAVSFTAYPQELSSAGMVAAKPIWARLRRRYGCRHEGFRLSQVHSPLALFPAFLALRASNCNGWARSWGSGQGCERGRGRRCIGLKGALGCHVFPTIVDRKS